MKRTRFSPNTSTLFKLTLTLSCAVAMLSLSCARIVRAQELLPSPATSIQAIDKAELHQALLDLTSSWTVMCVAAHPDDEDGTTLTILRRKFGVHTVSVFVTYGEGGQNAVGAELYEELGIVRTRETMNAAEIQGSEPYFLGLTDFGFSKSAAEAFRVWGQEEALSRMVLKIRELRPDVIITNHDTVSGHGHHQATGRLLLDAFDAAADPKRFPEQLNHLKPWQPQRLFVRNFGSRGPGNKTESTEKVVAIDPNEVDRARHTTFAEQSLAALQKHATQGPWPKSIEEWLKARRSESGKMPLVRYRLVREAAHAQLLPASPSSLLDGLKPPAFLLERVAALAIDGKPLTEFLDQPDRVLDTLVKWRLSNPTSEDSVNDPHRLDLLEDRFNKAMATALGVRLSINTHSPVVVPGMDTTFSITLANAGDRETQVNQLRFTGWQDQVTVETAEQLLPDTETTGTVNTKAPQNLSFTLPREEHLYDGLFPGRRFEANAELEIGGARFLVDAHKNVDVAPAVEIKDVSPAPCIRTLETLGRCGVLKITLTNHVAVPFRGKLKISLASRTRYPAPDVTHQIVLGPLETRTETVLANTAIPDKAALNALRKSGTIALSIHPLDSDDVITARTIPVVFSAARVVADLQIGYIASFDQTLERSLAALGVESRALTVNDIQTGNLSVYKTIIIDNRGYEAQPGLIAANARLLDFVQQGGTLIVLYHKDDEWNPDASKNRPALAPYPITLGSGRVTDEKATIRFLAPRHPLMNFPNRIHQADFEKWIQERGLYYPKEWDSRYTALFSSNDAGEEPLRGGLLVARYGKGNYIYTSMAWYRQLRGGVPGAYRMFANMISHGHR